MNASNPLGIRAQKFLISHATNRIVLTVISFPNVESAMPFKTKSLLEHVKSIASKRASPTQDLQQSLGYVLKDMPIINALDRNFNKSQLPGQEYKESYTEKEVESLLKYVAVVVPNIDLQSFSFTDDSIGYFIAYGGSVLMNDRNPLDRFGVYSSMDDVFDSYSNLKKFLSDNSQSAGARKTSRGARKIHVGRRGGKYYIKNGKKVYV
jgi:hypothetical protein